MSIAYSISTTYSSNGQRFASSIDQGSTYLGVPFASPITFDNTLTVTEPRSEALFEPTVSNYPTVPNSYFMGFGEGGSIPCPDCPVRPPVPSAGTGVIFAAAVIVSFLAISRSRG